MTQETRPADDSTVGRHYQGALGEEYFAWQREGALLGAELEAPKFTPFIGPDDVVVDFGCGTGYLLEQLPAARRIGVEVNDAARAHAASRGLEVVASSTELADGTADVVITNHALEHTLRPLDELRDLRRVLRPGGRLVLYVPLDDWRRQRHPDPSDINHHLYTWTPLLLANLLDEAGFTVERADVVTSAWPQFHEQLYRLLPRPAFDAACRVWAVLRRHRQVMALAQRPADPV